MKFFRNKKIIFSVLFLAIILILASFVWIKTANAQSTSTVVVGGSVSSDASEVLGSGSIFSQPLVWLATGIGYILGYIGGLFLSVASFLVELGLNINFGLLTSLTVQTGWKIVLNFANLGFVLAIIIIAFATIFRAQSYAMQQTLRKLIMAALLVNFSLVIAGAFINVSDIFSNFFLKQGGFTNPSQWSDAFAGMFKAQALLRTTASSPDLTGAMNAFGGASLTVVGSIFFTAIFTLLAAITIFACAVMLLIRYVYLGVLLLLSPIVWLLWIFPGTSAIWQAWWKKFIHWTFFAPIMLFFMYLTMYTMKNQTNLKTIIESPNNVKLTFGVDVLGEMMIVIGLVVGGLIASNSLGINFSSTAMGWANNVGKQFGDWVGRKGVRLGTTPLRGKTGRGAIEGMQKTGLGLGRFGRVMTSPIRYIGEAMSGVGIKQSEKLVADAEKRVSAYKSDKTLAESFTTLSREDQIAAVKRFMKNKTMNLLDEKNLNYYIGKEATRKSFARFGAENVYNDFEKAAGRNTRMVNIATSKTITPEEKKTQLKEAADDFHKTFTPKDYENVRTKAFTDDENFAEANVEGMMNSNPNILSKITPKLNSKQFEVSDEPENPAYKSFRSKVDRHFNKLIDDFIHTIDETANIANMDAKSKLEWLRGRIGRAQGGIAQADYDKFEHIHSLMTKNLAKRMQFEFEGGMPPPAA